MGDVDFIVFGEDGASGDVVVGNEHFVETGVGDVLLTLLDFMWLKVDVLCDVVEDRFVEELDAESVGYFASYFKTAAAVLTGYGDDERDVFVDVGIGVWLVALLVTGDTGSEML